MINRSLMTVGIVAVVAVGVVAAGCGRAPAPAAKKVVPAVAVHDHDEDHGHDHDHDHGHADHESHDTLTDALTELKKVCVNAKGELAAKNLDKADGHVHMVGHLIDDMHKLVGTSQLPAEGQAAAKKALDEIFECFDDLDSALHSSDSAVREAVDYLKHEPKIDAAIRVIEQLVGPTRAEPAPAREADE